MHRDLRTMTVELLHLGRHSLREALVVSRQDPQRVLGVLLLEDISAAVSRSETPSG
jgi:hypothetical protein